MSTERIHEDQTVLSYGTALEEAGVAVLLLHGRGAMANSMMELAADLPSAGVSYLMPQAFNNTWYPNSGFAPFEENEPYLSSAMNNIEERLQTILNAGISREKIVIGGFSQGACLAAEFTARQMQPFGGLLILSGALMGPADAPRDYHGNFAGMPVYIGGVDDDPWVTKQQMQETAEIFEALGADVRKRIDRGSNHTIHPADIDHAGQLIERVHKSHRI